MPQRDDFHFVLQPWEHRGVHFDARPDFVVLREADGVRQLFLLKVRANRLFFRLAEDETRVWATTDTIQGPVVEFWKRQIEERRFARLFVDQVHIDERRYERTDMAALVNDYGQAWLCEWCSDIWWPAQTPHILEKYVRTHRKLGVWHSQWRPHIQKLLRRNREAIFQRPMPPSERAATSIRWICGSEKELEILLQNFCFSYFDALNQLTVNDAYSPKSLPGTFRFSLTSDSIESEFTLRFDWGWRHSERFLEILDVFLAYNRVAGLKWQRGWYLEQEGAIRGDWRHSSHVRVFDFYRQHPTPAGREQASLSLRDWLRDKVPHVTLEAWLLPVAPA